MSKLALIITTANLLGNQTEILSRPFLGKTWQFPGPRQPPVGMALYVVIPHF